MMIIAHDSITFARVPTSEEIIFQEKLNAQAEMLHGMGHFEAITELPQVLEVLP